MSHRAIQIRDQIAAQIINTAYGIYTARTKPFENDELPAVLVMIGGDEIEEESVGDRIQTHTHEFLLRCYVGATGDVDRAIWDVIQNCLEALAGDPTLAGLADDSEPTEVSEPEYEEGNKKHITVDVTYRVFYATASTNL